MMETKKGKKCRNLPEQVQKNMEDIALIKGRYPTVDYVINAVVDDEDSRLLHVTKLVDGHAVNFDFKGGDNLLAGTNITITETEEGLVIAATTEPVGSVSFENIAGSPFDNTLLANELNNRFKLQFATPNGNETNGWLRIKNQSGIQIQNTLDNKMIWISDGTLRYYPDKTQTQTYIDLEFGDHSGTIAVTDDIPTKVSELEDDIGIVTGAGGTISNVNSIKLGLYDNYDTYQAGAIFHHYNGNTYSLFLPDKNGTFAITNDLIAYQKKLTPGTGITIDSNNVISATGETNVPWGNITGTLANQIDLKNALDAKQDVSTLDTDVTALGFIKDTYHDDTKQDTLESGINIKTLNGLSILGPGNIQISGEPETYIKSQSVSGNTLTWINKDGSTGSFTPTGQEGGITDVKVNGTSVVSEGVANILIPQDAQLVYDLTLNTQTGQVTINNPNYYQRILDYIEENDKYPIIYGVIHITSQPDLVVICKDIAISAQGIIINGYITSFGGNYTTNNHIEITTTASLQSAVYDETKFVNGTAPRITKVEVTDNSIFFEDASGHDNTYTPTYNNLPDKPDLSVYQVAASLDNDVSALGFIKGITISDLQDLVEGSQFISVDENPTTEKLQISFDFTDLPSFLEFADNQEVVASWTDDEKPLLQLNLKQELSNKINNSLQLPLTHTEETLVGVDTTGGQEQIKIDANTLEINNRTLRAKIPTPQEVHLYEHTISLYITGSYPCEITLFIINTSEIALTTIETLITNLPLGIRINCNGWIDVNGTLQSLAIITKFKRQTDTYFRIHSVLAGGSEGYKDISYDNVTNIVDNVRQII